MTSGTVAGELGLIENHSTSEFSPRSLALSRSLIVISIFTALSFSSLSVLPAFLLPPLLVPMSAVVSHSGERRNSTA